MWVAPPGWWQPDATGGLLVNARWSFLPVGPSIVLILFAQFVIAYSVL